MNVPVQLDGLQWRALAALHIKPAIRHRDMCRRGDGGQKHQVRGQSPSGDPRRGRPVRHGLRHGLPCSSDPTEAPLFRLAVAPTETAGVHKLRAALPQPAEADPPTRPRLIPGAISTSVSATISPRSRRRAAVSPTLCHWTGPRSAHAKPVRRSQSRPLSADFPPASNSATTGPHTNTSPATRRSSNRADFDPLPCRRYSTQTEVSARTVTSFDRLRADAAKDRQSQPFLRVAGAGRPRRA